MRGRISAVVDARSRRASAPPDFAAFSFPGNGHVDGFSPPATYPAGVELFREAEPAEDVLYLEHGLVKLQRLRAEGEEFIVGLRSAGWVLAAASVMLERPRAATAVTVTTCRIARMKAESFRRRVRAGGELSWSVHCMHSAELYTQLELVTDFNTAPARVRLQQFLRSLAAGLSPGSDAGEVRFELPLRHWEIAQIIGVTAPYLSQLMSELEVAGILRRDKHAMFIRPKKGQG